MNHLSFEDLANTTKLASFAELAMLFLFCVKFVAIPIAYSQAEVHVFNIVKLDVLIRPVFVDLVTIQVGLNVAIHMWHIYCSYT